MILRSFVNRASDHHEFYENLYFTLLRYIGLVDMPPHREGAWCIDGRCLCFRLSVCMSCAWP